MVGSEEVFYRGEGSFLSSSKRLRARVKPQVLRNMFPCLWKEEQVGRTILLSTPDFPALGTHELHARKFLGGFRERGYEFHWVESSAQFAELEVCADDLVYFGSHGLVEGRPLTETQLNFLERVQKTGAFPIFWYWHDRVELLTQIYGSRWILTGELFRAQTVLPSHASAAAIFSEHPNALPVRFAASVVPGASRQLPHHDRVLLAAYIGARYHVMRNRFIKLRFSGVRVRYYPPFLSETDRINLFFRPTKVVLGWHNTANISNGTVSERVYEGLAHGALVVTDNPYAEAATDGNVIFVSESSDLVPILNRAKKDRAWWAQRSESGLKWVRDHGTYRGVADEFLEKIRSLSN